MTVINLARRLEKLETAKRAANSIASMTDEQLRTELSSVVDQLGGKESTLDLLRSSSAVDPGVIRMMEEWPAWPL